MKKQEATQEIFFPVKVTLDKFTVFEANQTYIFTVTDDQWLEFEDVRIISLAAFANCFTDRGHAQFVDAAA